MTKKIDKSLLWLEKQLFLPRRRKTYCLFLFCLLLGILASLFFNLMKAEEMLTLTCIIITIISATKVALSCRHYTMKYIVVPIGSIKQIIINKIILPVCRIEAFTFIFSITAFIFLLLKNMMSLNFFLRFIFCVIEIPIIMCYLVTTYLMFRRTARTFIQILSIFVFNLFFLIQKITLLAYFAEGLFVGMLFLLTKYFFDKLTYETILNKGARL